MSANTPEADRRIHVSVELHPDGQPRHFVLHYAKEQTSLAPGKNWTKVDVHKWITRGIIEPPQSFHINADASVDINGQHIALDQAESPAQLEEAINKRHEAAFATRKQPAADPVAPHPNTRSVSEQTGRVVFRVRLDHVGHLMIESLRGQERIETGMKGLAGLVQHGLMLRPQSIHLDPLQRGIDIDGTFYPCTDDGARALQDALNSRYAPALKAEEELAVHIRENPASATGYDIQFATLLAGARLEIKGHLSQERLDILQDFTRCHILNPGIILRLSPPNFLIRRRRPDGGEEPIPELPDVNYRRTRGDEIQRLLNHPLVRRSSGKGTPDAATLTAAARTGFVRVQLRPHPENRQQLLMDCHRPANAGIESRAFTHHNIEQLQHQGTFNDDTHVHLSLDHRHLTIQNRTTSQTQSMDLDPQSSPEDLATVSAWLTAALKPPPPARAPAPASAERTPPPTGRAQEVNAYHEPQAAQNLSKPPHTPVPVAREGRDDLRADSSLEMAKTPQPSVPPPQHPPPAPVIPVTQTPSHPRNPYPAVETLAARPPRIPAQATAAPPKTPDAPSAENAPPPSTKPLPPEPSRTLSESDAQSIILEVFRVLAAELPVHEIDVRLSLPRVFDQRRFEILSLSHPEIVSVFELRSEDFHGFYLTHLSDTVALLVYARKGWHIEWGSRRCEIQPHPTADAHEFRHPALLGLALDDAQDYVFLVTPEYREWVRPHDKSCLAAHTRFMNPQEARDAAGSLTILWQFPLSGS